MARFSELDIEQQELIKDKEELLWSVQQGINRLSDLVATSDELALYIKRIQDHCDIRLDEKWQQEVVKEPLTV